MDIRKYFKNYLGFPNCYEFKMGNIECHVDILDFDKLTDEQLLEKVFEQVSIDAIIVNTLVHG